MKGKIRFVTSLTSASCSLFAILALHPLQSVTSTSQLPSVSHPFISYSPFYLMQSVIQQLHTFPQSVSQASYTRYFIPYNQSLIILFSSHTVCQSSHTEFLLIKSISHPRHIVPSFIHSESQNSPRTPSLMSVSFPMVNISHLTLHVSLMQLLSHIISYKKPVVHITHIRKSCSHRNFSVFVNLDLFQFCLSLSYLSFLIFILLSYLCHTSLFISMLSFKQHLPVTSLFLSTQKQRAGDDSHISYLFCPILIFPRKYKCDM